MSAIEKLLTAFIVPLQGDAISTPDHRIHCSLNLNTETGRLSARRPNLQNQPALEKDRYKASSHLSHSYITVTLLDRLLALVARALYYIAVSLVFRAVAKLPCTILLYSRLYCGLGNSDAALLLLRLSRSARHSAPSPAARWWWRTMASWSCACWRTWQTASR